MWADSRENCDTLGMFLTMCEPVSREGEAPAEPGGRSLLPRLRTIADLDRSAIIHGRDLTPCVQHDSPRRGR
jgi:hypothetical protein